jgi:uncharacterized protein YjbI with pentapeptide repeats
LKPVLALALLIALTAVAAPAPASAQTPPGSGCIRRYVPNPPTLSAVTNAHPGTVNTISVADFMSLPVGPTIPDSTQDPNGFQQAMQAIYNSGAGQCAAIGQRQGDLIKPPNSPETAILAPAPPSPSPLPWCVRRHVPNPQTLNAIPNTYTVSMLPAAEFQAMASGQPVPDITQSVGQFNAEIQPVYSQNQTRCAQQGLATGNLIGVNGSNEIDVVVAATTGDGVQCLRQATPPAPPSGGAVIAGRFDPSSTQPNVVVIPAGATWRTGDCGGTAIMTNPTSIAVAGPPQPAALIFEDEQHGLFSPWGAVNVDANSAAPVLFPGHSEFTTTKAVVIPPEYYAVGHGSCRSCWLKDVPDMLPPPQTPRSNYAFWGDLSAATLSGATLLRIDGQSTVSLSNVNLSSAKLDGVKGLTGANLTQANLSGVDLSGTDLSSADVTGANMMGANLSRAVNVKEAKGLNRANLSGANLSGVDLSGELFPLYGGNLGGANLSGANLNSANAYSVNLSGANLSGADLGNTALQGANLGSANLSDANLNQAELDCLYSYQDSDGTFGCNGGQTDLSGANLQNVVGLKTADLFGVVLTGAQGLRGVDLSGARMRVADLHSTDLSNADLSQADLTKANLRQANLSGANLVGTQGLADDESILYGANLTAAKLHGTDLHGASMDDTTLTSADLSGANLQQANLTGATLTSADLSGASLQRANLTLATMPSIDLSNHDLSGTILTRANLHQANLSQANLSGAALTHVDLSGANLTYTWTGGGSRFDLAGNDLSGANLSGATGLANATLQNINLSGANLTTTNLSSASLDSANLTSADLSAADLSGASLQDAQLSQTRVNGTNFDGASLEGAQLVKLQVDAPPSFSGVSMGESVSGGCTVFQDTDLSTATFTMNGLSGLCLITTPLLPGSTVRVDAIPALWVKGFYNVDLGNAIFVVDASNRSRLAGYDLSGVNLSSSAFVGWPVDLSGTNLNGANLENARLPGAVLSGASLQNVKAAGASFRGASLASNGTAQAATFAGSSTDLSNADFVDADLSGASFVAANISGASFENALAMAPDFNSVVAMNVKFIGAHIHDNSGKAFDNANDLSGADFSGAVLVGDRSLGGGFNLTSTNLQGAHFDYAQCIGCNFTSSNLDNATFSHAYLMGAVFSSATMQGADMTNAWLYCADAGNSQCAKSPDQPTMWLWPLTLSQSEAAGDIPFTPTDFTGVSGQLPKYCPDGTTDWIPDQDQINGSVVTGVCNGHLQPNSAWSLPGCSAAGSDACPTLSSLLFDASDLRGKLLSVVPMTPPVWSTTLPDSTGYAVGLDDATVRLAGGNAHILAGSSGRACPQPTQACGDGGPAGQALLGTPAGLAVGRDGSLYIADSAMHRIRRIDPSGTITTVAGSGQPCTANGASACGNGGAATAAQLTGPYGVWIDPLGQLVIADGSAGLRQVGIDGTLSLLAGTNAYDVRSVVGDATGSLYAAAHNPDYLIQIDTSGKVSVVVGTGTSGYNGNIDNSNPYLPSLLDGNQVQISDPDGLSVDANGNILFADTGNNMVRAYVPQGQHVMDPLGGCTDDNGNPQGGNNGVGQWSDQIELSGPIAVTSTSGPLLVVADTGNKRLLQLGPSPESSTGPTCATASNSAAPSSDSVAMTSVLVSYTPTPTTLPTLSTTHAPAASHTRTPAGARSAPTAPPAAKP